MPITSSDLPGILSALHDTSSDLDKLTQQELDWHIDHGDYSDAEKSYLKLDEVYFVATMRCLVILNLGFEDWLIGNNVHDTIKAWIDIRKISAKVTKQSQLEKQIYGTGRGHGYGQPDDTDHLLRFPPGQGSFASLSRDDQQFINDLRAKASVDHSLLRVMLACARRGIDYRFVTENTVWKWKV